MCLCPCSNTSERYTQQAMQLIVFKQAIIQGVWFSQSPLKQLPHWTQPLEKALENDFNICTIQDLARLDPHKLTKVLTEAHSNVLGDHSHLISEKHGMRGTHYVGCDISTTPCCLLHQDWTKHRCRLLAQLLKTWRLSRL